MRESQSILAIHNKTHSMLHLWQLQIMPQSQVHIIKVATHPARQVIKAKVSRPSVDDLLILQNGKPVLISASGSMLPLSTISKEDLISIKARGTNLIDGTTKSRVKILLDVNLTPHDILVQQIFEAMSLVLPHEVFLTIYSAFLLRPRENHADKELDYFCAIISTLITQGSLGAAKLSSWQRLLAKRQSDQSFPPSEATHSIDPSSIKIANANAVQRKHLEAILFALHLMHEDLSLLARHELILGKIGRLLFDLACTSGLIEWREYYARKGYSTTRALNVRQDPSPVPRLPPDLLAALTLRLSSQSTDVPSFSSPASLASVFSFQPSLFFGSVQTCILTQQLLQIYSLFTANTTAQLRAYAVALEMHKLGWLRRDLEELDIGVALPLWEALRTCSESPPSNWPPSAYVLIGRLDLAMHAGASMPPKMVRLVVIYQLD